MPVGTKCLLPHGGNVIFRRGELGESNQKASKDPFDALEKCLSAQSASCRTAATSFFSNDILFSIILLFL